MTDPVGLILRVAHIYCGVFWVGAAIMLAAFIEPTIGAIGPAGGKFMQQLMGPRRFGPFMAGSALVTSGSGLTMLWLGAGSSLANWWGSGYERAILIGSIAGLAALVSGLAVNTPTAGRLARIAREIEAGGGPPRNDQLAEIARLQKRLHAAGLLSAVLLTISVVAMAAAHYL